jgi:wyosine [tRNA(Phe)-imidazoG37] synthetase (radical SAM superfamily)
MDLLALQKGIIYGPVHSRRLGRSVGVNLLPEEFKLCSMNCCYCQYGWTPRLVSSGNGYAPFLPTLSQTSAAVRELLESRVEFDYLTFSGNGEATLHPDFSEIVDIILRLREEYKHDFKLALLSNSTTCNKPEIREVISRIDVPIMKLDAGNEPTFRAMNHAHSSIDYDEIVTGLGKLDRFVLQSMFLDGDINNTGAQHISDWISMLKSLQPMWVQVYSLDRGTASRHLQRVPRARLEQIAEQAHQATKLQIEVY